MSASTDIRDGMTAFMNKAMHMSEMLTSLFTTKFESKAEEVQSVLSI